MEIVSFPGPDRSVTPEGLKTFKVSSRRYRNRRIGEFLKELHLTEGRNTGFRKILRALERNGSPKPEFETDDDRSYFIARLFAHEGFADEKEPTLEETGDKTASHRRAILDILEREGTAKTSAIAEALGLKPTRTREILAAMVKDGAIVAHGERKARYYRLPWHR